MCCCLVVFSMESAKRQRSFVLNSVSPPMLDGSLSLQHGVSLGCEWRDGLKLWRVAANTLNKQPQTNDKG
jgi:hypothetical protein